MSNQRGGARPGAGRKKQKETAVTISICMTPAQKEKLLEDVEKSGLTRSAYILSKIFS